MILFAIAYLITGALAQTGTKIALDNVDSVNAPTALGDLLEQEYVDEGCEKAGWGPFPNASSTSLTAEAYSKAHGASGCKCGMLYGLAHSSVQRENDVAAISSTAQAQGPTPCTDGFAAGFP